MSALLSTLSELTGWTYFILWSASFYPIAWTMYYNKNATGVSIDYSIISIYGYVMYLIYTYTGFIYPQIGTNHVSSQDVFFATHSVMMCSTYITGILIFKNGNQRIHLYSYSIIMLCMIVTIIIFIFEMRGTIAGNKFLNTAMF